jgi:hypothetical protein
MSEYRRPWKLVTLHFKAKSRILCVRLFLLWLPFSLGCLVAIPLSLIAILGGSVYAKNMLLAMDKLGAASMKFSGLNTVSAECGRLLHEMKDGLTARCILCKLLCRFVHEMDAGHCDRNARGDGLITDLETSSRDDGLITDLETSSTLGVTAGERAPTI